MRILKPLQLGLLTRSYEHQRRFYLGVAVFSFVSLGHEPLLHSESGLWAFLTEELPPDQPVDVGIPKSRPEFLVVGRAFAPAGTPVSGLRVTVRLANRVKILHIYGDRQWEGDRATDPVPFATMPLDWTHAYGGPGYAANPVGKGIVPVGGQLPLPNVVDPAHSGSVRFRQSAGFGPLNQTWAARAQFAGTYDDRWLKEDYPGFARDMDLRHFNLAPSDQHFARPLAGDEEYALENMHPEDPVLTGRLPGIVPRAFLVQQGSDVFEEVALALTTVWFFPHRRRLVLVHHGRADVAMEDASDMSRIVVGADRLGKLRDIAHYRNVMEGRLDPERGATLSLRDSDLAPAELLVPDPALKAEEALHSTEGLLQKHSHCRMEREIAAKRAYVASFGLDPDLHGPAMPPVDEPLPTLEELPAYIKRLLTEAERQKAEQEADQARRDKELEKLLKDTGMTFAQVKAEQEARPAGPPTFTAAGMRRELEELASRCRITGIDAGHIDEILTDPEMLAVLADVETQQREGYRLSAHMQDPAPPMEPARSEACRQQLAADRTRSRSYANFAGADFSGCHLANCNLEGAWLDGANLARADLRGAVLKNAVVAHANLEGCKLDGVDATGANLGRARLSGASLRGVKLKDAILGGADLRSAVLRGANLEGADLSEAKLMGADLAEARAAKIVLMKAAIAGLFAPGAVFDGAVFLEADVAGANFAGASMVGATFVKANASRLEGFGADLRKACFLDGCRLDGVSLGRANLAEANLRGTNLAGADLRGAVLDDADLSECDLRGADLHRARAHRVRLVAANLGQATLTRADLMNAALGRADLRGADLRGASLYEADLARVRVDRLSHFDGALMTRMRTRPRHRP